MSKSARSKSPLGTPLRIINMVAGSEWIDKLRLREPAQKFLYQATKTGFEAQKVVTERFMAKGSSSGKGAPDSMKSPAKPKLFDLNPTEEQKMTQETMRSFANEVIRPAAFEADEGLAIPDGLLNQSHELGIAHLAIPEAHGGMGEERSPVANTLIIEELSRGDMGIALGALAPLGVINTLVDWGTADQKARYLHEFAGESFVPAAMAVLESRPLFDPMAMNCTAVVDGDGYVINGEKCMVPLGANAELFLIGAMLQDKGPRLFIVRGGTEGLLVKPGRHMGLRAAGLCDLKLDGVRVSRDALLGDDSFDFSKLIANSRVAWGAMAVGTCQAVLDYTVPYCNERIAFGEPITNRQSVAFNLADMALELEGMRLMVYRAASLLEQNLDFTDQSFLARIQCTEKGMKIGSDGVQMLGGHGFIREHPVERWYRHLRAIGVFEGALLI